MGAFNRVGGLGRDRGYRHRARRGVHAVALPAGLLRQDHARGEQGASRTSTCASSATLIPLVVLCFWIGLYPKPFFRIIEPSIQRIVPAVDPDYLSRPVAQLPTPPPAAHAQEGERCAPTSSPCCPNSCSRRSRWRCCSGGSPRGGGAGAPSPPAPSHRSPRPALHCGSRPGPRIPRAAVQRDVRPRPLRGVLQGAVPALLGAGRAALARLPRSGTTTGPASTSRSCCSPRSA